MMFAKYKRVWIAAAVLALPGILPQASAQSSVLDTLRPEHPRLFTLDSDLPEIKKMLSNDPVAKHNYQEVRATADAMLLLPVKTYPKPSSMLATAHVVEDRVVTLAGMYRLTGELRYAIRAKQEMFSAASYPDWNPKHFLEAAEMTAALGIGYDWLYKILTPDERATLRTAMVSKGIQPWLDNIRGPANLARMGNNWVQVCTGGITVGALAIAEDDPARAKEVLDDSKPIMKSIMGLFAPDGGFEEGPTYWDYAVSYNVLYLASVKSALGTDFGLGDLPGFSQTGDYRMQSLGPFWRAANFSDAHEDVPRAFEMYWLSHRFNKPEYQMQEERYSAALDKAPDARKKWESERFAIFSLFWYRPFPGAKDVEAPLGRSFERINVAFLRNSWAGPTPWYVGLKGGANKAHHAHLDLGTFILDAMGERWGRDLGGEDYGVPGYFDFAAQRWTYFRTRTESHNTLIVDDANQDIEGTGKLTFTGAAAGGEVATMELDAYKSKLKTWKRGVQVMSAGRVLLQDEIEPIGTPKVEWQFHTDAKIKIDATGKQATLSQDGQTMVLRILAPATGQFSLKEFKLAANETPAPGLSNLTIALPKLATPETIAVLFSAEADKTAPPAVTPIAGWVKP